MSIAPFKKVSLLGLTQDKQTHLSALQDLGCMHLIAINPPKPSVLTATSSTLIEKIKAALRYLNEAPEKGRPRLIWNDFNPDAIVQAILDNQQALRACIDRCEFLNRRIHDLKRWGDFVLPDEAALAGVKLWFYKITYEELPLIPKEAVIQALYRNNRHIYLVWLACEEPLPNPFSAPRVHTGALALHTLQEELNTLNEQMDDLIDARRNLTRYRYLLSRAVAGFIDKTELNKAHEKTQDHDEFCLIQGWAPESQIERLNTFCLAHDLAFVVEAPLPGELPPTLMTSSSFMAPGPELVNFYQTPGYHSLDPSNMVFFSFSVFFAMILADAGYGLIMGLFTLFAWRPLAKYNGALWLRPLLVVISSFSIAYGVLLGSYFGVEPKAGTFLATLKCININNFKAMMALVLIIGCLHIGFACALRAWHARTRYEQIQSLSVVTLIIGVMSFSIALINHQQLMKQGAILIMVLSLLMMMISASAEPIHNVKSLLIRIIKGLGAIAEIPSLFGDILSYLRLFALGLAGASLAVTFNAMGQQVAHSSGWVLGGLIILIGQAMNFLLCLMGAVIHGLRLNYIEFFKWSMKEDGYRYQPFKKEESLHE